MVKKTVLGQAEKAFAQRLYDEYYALVFHTILKMVSNRHDAQELANDVLVKLFEKIPLLQTFECCTLAAYVVYTARNVAINFCRRRAVRQKHTYLGLESDMADVLAGKEATQEDILLLRESACALADALDRLPEWMKDMLYFKYLLELSDKQIATTMDIAPSSVRMYLTRARRAARVLLEKGDGIDV